MTFMGSDATDGLSADFQGDVSESVGPYQLFSFRNFINFLLGFSWTGIAFSTVIQSHFWLLATAIGAGLAFVSIFFIVIGQLLKLAEDNTFKMEMALNKTASVYLHIPSAQAGKGKILVSVRGAVHEVEAITRGESIASGQEVKVVKIVNESLVEVEKIN